MRKLIAISTILLASAALLGLWAGDRKAPVVYSFSGLHGGGVFLGVELVEEIDYSEGGARITRVVEASAAAEAGLEEGDIIVAFDGRTVRGPRALTQQLRDHEPGDEVSITVVRDGREQTLDVELGERKGLGFACDEDDEDCTHSFSWSCEGDDCEDFDFDFDFDFGNLWGRPMLGVQLSSVTDELREHLGGEPGVGILVSKVLENSAAEEAGVAVGDLIVAVGGENVADAGDIREALADRVGETFDVEVIRDGRPLRLDVTIPERDDDAPTGPRALHFAPRIELEGVGAHLDEVMEHVREALEQSHDAYGRALQLRDAEVQESLREALEHSREVRQDAVQRAREALEKSRAMGNMI